MTVKTKILLGQLLLDKKIITAQQLETALRKQKETGDLLGVALIKLGFIDEETIYYPILAEQLGVEYINLKNTTIRKDVIAKVPVQFASFYRVLPIDFSSDTLTIASAHPFDINILDGIGLIVPGKIKAVLAAEKAIGEAIQTYYGVGADTIDQMMGSLAVDKIKDREVEDIEEIESEASIGKFISQILLQAYKDRATDIHIEPFDNELRIRYRVDGVLLDTKVPTNIRHFKDSINSRIKIMSNLNIAEKRLPQDGRFQVKVGDVDLDLRVSFLPSQYGESLVIRLLSSTKLYDMKELGLSESNLKILNELIKKPHGIIFVTGPTGSGKTTTLYSALAHLNRADKKIITIEDPIEYQLGGVVQIQVNPTIGLNFARGLRSMLRHDPDIMMVGEVRDRETAEISIQTALTGHLVFSTLHTNDAASAITRLLDMGIEPYLVSSSVECFIAQRLIRLLCPKCKIESKVTNETIKSFHLDPQQARNLTIYEEKGCDACNWTGFYGRLAIYEFLLVTDDVKNLITQRAHAIDIKHKAVERGMQTLLQDGWEKVKQGLTTTNEVIRVTKEEDS